MTAAKTMDLAIGRLLSMMSRPEQAGDIEAYYNVSAAILDSASELGLTGATYRPEIRRYHQGFDNSTLTPR